jgi:hypothetical protein
MRRARDLEGARAGDNAAVDNHVVDAAQAVTHGLLDLRDGVRVGAFDEDGDRLGFLDLFLRAVRRSSWVYG